MNHHPTDDPALPADQPATTPAGEPDAGRQPSTDQPVRRSRWAFMSRPGMFSTGLAIGIVMLLAGGTGIAGFRLGADAGVRGLPEEFVNLERLVDTVESSAFDPPSPEVLVDGAIEGLLGTLDDRYAVYYGPDRFTALNTGLDGEFVGIGVTIEERADGIFIVGVLSDSPAERAGVMVEERIVAVDGASATDGETSSEIVAMIAGEAGTDVTLTVDSGALGERDVTITRELIDYPEVVTRVLDSGFGYASVRQFSRQVDEQLLTQVEAMIASDDIGGLVLDLRRNPGGLLQESVEVVSLFAEEGTVVRVDSRDASVARDVSGDAPLADLPLVVLVDGNSASASEIVAGALQDLDRAQVVGVQTFGKGTVQTIRDLDLGAGVKFTTAKYFTPSGDSIEGVGVTPDVLTSDDPDQQLVAAEAALTRLLVESDGS